MPAVIVNGVEHSLDEGASVADAVRATGAADGARGVAVALEGEVVPRGEWEATRLSDGCRVEVLQAVQGG